MRSTLEKRECSFCGKTEKADYVCEEGHYVCESCRLASPETLVRKVCRATKETDSMKVVLLLMKHPALQMHGPEHHYVVSCALLAALRNLGRFEINDSAFDEAIRRGRKILLASCGLWGMCDKNHPSNFKVVYRALVTSVLAQNPDLNAKVSLY